MNQLLRPNQVIHVGSMGLTCTVVQYLGGGGQGEVYKVNMDGKPFALKWYYPASATPEQKANIEKLINIGPPTDNFLWPMELTDSISVPDFGYIMPLRALNFKNIVDLMKRRVEPSFHALVTACFELASNYMDLHSQGLCYQDISFGNVFFDPQTGQVLICDNDNVCINGQGTGGVMGTPRFMAPEVVRGETIPSTDTDLFSLAVLLFYMLMGHHPLEGKKESAIHCLDLPAMNKLYGTEPLFIFDPQDSSNEPDPLYHGNALSFWPVYPQFLRDIFTRAFTDGIRDPKHGRVRETEWRSALIRLRDSILYCSHCAAENFL